MEFRHDQLSPQLLASTHRPTLEPQWWSRRPIRLGSDGGYATEGDVLVNQTSDGIDLNVIWNEAAAVMATWNRERTALASLISYSTVAVGDAIPQAPGGENFERASEYGEPEGIRSAPDALVLGYDFVDYDLASRFTWRFLRAATAEQVRDAINRALEADVRLVTGTLLRRLFDPTEGRNEHGHRVFGLYNGDGIVPPPYGGVAFSGTTSHYLASSNSVVDPGDLLDAIEMVRSKGFGLSNSTRLVVLCNPAEAEEISTFRAGIETNGVESKYDFIPSASAPPYIMGEGEIVGQIAPGEFAGLEVQGSYGPAWVLPSYYVPAGYLAVVATGGPNSSLNPVAFRQHQNPAYQGLRIIPGRDQRYPLQDSFFARGFGTGVRYRGAACVVQVTAGSTFTPPTWSWS